MAEDEKQKNRQAHKRVKQSERDYFANKFNRDGSLKSGASDNSNP